VNTGFDGISTNWECKATLPTGMKFGKTKVICEGYESRADSYVLVGSCGV
jgi:hypothetical protein